MNNSNFRQWILIICTSAGFISGSHATGVLPDSTIVIISESDGQAQIGIKNTDDAPLLLNTTITDLEGDDGISVFVEPALARIEPQGRQLIRFLLKGTSSPMTVQHMKKVSFEGIPGKSAKPVVDNRSVMAFTIRHTMPMVISPAGLVQDSEPWKLLTATRIDDHRIELSNPSVFVVRMYPEVKLLPSKLSITLASRTYLLPGEKVTIDHREKLPASDITGLQLVPASPWGYMMPSYDIPVGK